MNLSGQPGGTWVSPSAQRAGTCCGVSNNCVEFSIVLDSAAVGINFSVASGADPGGALAYQINCGPVYYTGTPICLNGPGPHIITFCKPGNNINTYQITSIPGPQVSPPIIVNDGCTGVLSVSGLEPATVSWTSVYPGPPGAYNSYASCLSGCLSTTITGQTNPPAYVDYQVCGTVIGSCGQANYCDTIRAYFNPTLAVSIVPQNPTVCFGDAGVSITAVGSGGQAPYTYTWSNGATTPSVFVGPGTYTVTMQDNSNCPPVSNTVQVTEFLVPILADAGPDQYLCRQAPQASLAGNVQAATGLQWSSSGGGTFSPSDTALNAIYTPSASELSAGSAVLIAQTTGNGTCPPDLDTVVIYYGSFQALLSPVIQPVSCFGLSDGSITVNISGANAPYTFSWFNGSAAPGVSGLAAGTYNLTVTDRYGCDSTFSFIVTEPPLLTASASVSSDYNGQDISCNGASDGSALALATGGTASYVYAWSSGAAQASATGLAAGTYTVQVTDANGCIANTTVTLTEPPLLTISASVTSNYNGQDVSCNGASDGSAAAL
ncbi:MAG: SprB repeat-containing protein, partial [Flavobacteriales bacterium]